MNTTTFNISRFAALLAALFLTGAEIVVMDYDAQQRAAHYLAEAAGTVGARS